MNSKFGFFITLFIYLFNLNNSFIVNNNNNIRKNNQINNIYDYGVFLKNVKDNDIDKKYCINCKYFLPQNNDKDVSKYGKCRKFIKEDIKLDSRARSCISPIYDDEYFLNNDGKNKYSLSDFFELCVNMRKNQDKCGFYGKYYES